MDNSDLLLVVSGIRSIIVARDESNLLTFVAAEFLRGWEKVGGTINEEDIFITNDPYSTEGAISHLNDVIILLPIYYKHEIVGWAANFGHLSYVVLPLFPSTTDVTP